MATKKIAKTKTALAPGKAIIYLHAAKSTKNWLNNAAKKYSKKQGGKVSASTMAEIIFNKAKKDPQFSTKSKAKSSSAH